jgi:hypothetical protein
MRAIMFATIELSAAAVTARSLRNLIHIPFPTWADQATAFFQAARCAIAHWAQIREGYERSVVGLSLISR